MLVPVDVLHTLFLEYWEMVVEFPGVDLRLTHSHGLATP